MAVLRNGSKCSHTTCMLRFFTVSRLALNTNLIFEIGSYYLFHLQHLGKFGFFIKTKAEHNNGKEQDDGYQKKHWNLDGNNRSVLSG